MKMVRKSDIIVQNYISYVSQDQNMFVKAVNVFF